MGAGGSHNARDMPQVAIVGGGIAGLATASFLRRLAPGLRFVLLEKGIDPGGKARSTSEGGFTFDWGPSSFRANAPETLELAGAVGLSERLLPASEVARNRFVYRDGGLRPVPVSPQAFLRSELLSPGGKLRALLEPVLASQVSQEESVHVFLSRHFGAGVAAAFADSLVSDTTVGNAGELSLDALFPQLRRLEREHRSLLRGLIGSQGGWGLPTSFREGGIQCLIDALRADLTPELLTRAEVTAFEPDASGGFILRLKEGGEVVAAQVVLATPAPVSATLLRPHSPEAAGLLAAIPYANVHVFGLGFDRIDVPRLLDGFGFVVPRGEGVRSLGVQWSSSIFPDQAPKGKVLLRVIAGGTVDPAFADLSRMEALATVRRDLEITMGITAEPEYVEAVYWHRGSPQYLLGHCERLERVERLIADMPGVTLTGDAYRGVGLNDCIRDAKRVATALAET